jgi:hypothetical protein
VLCDFADPAVRERRFVAFDLGDVVDDKEGGNDDVCADFEEECGGELADEHVELLLTYLF